MKGEVLDDVALLIHEQDTVATAIEDLPAGCTVDTGDKSVTLSENVAFGHKFAIKAMDEGDTVYKYGEAIGTAVTGIRAGDWVHTHNCESARGRGDKASTTTGQPSDCNE